MDGPGDASAKAGIAEGCRKFWVHVKTVSFLEGAGGPGGAMVVGGDTKAHDITLSSMELSRANWP